MSATSEYFERKVLLEAWRQPMESTRRTISRSWGIREKWLSLDGNYLHRIGGPALIDRDKKGMVLTESFYAHGFFHRIDGPARVRYSPQDGHVLESDEFSYGFIGDQAGDHAGVLAHLEQLGLDHLALVVSRSVFHPLLNEGVDATVVLAGLAEEVFTLEGMRAFVTGAPAEWVRSFEEAEVSR